MSCIWTNLPFLSVIDDCKKHFLTIYTTKRTPAVAVHINSSFFSVFFTCVGSRTGTAGLAGRIKIRIKSCPPGSATPWFECVVLAKLSLLFSKAEERGILLYANWFCMHCFMIEIRVADPDPDIFVGSGRPKHSVPDPVFPKG